MATLVVGMTTGAMLHPSPAFALEERIQDLSASVEVAAVFQCTLDNPHLAFGSVTPGQPATLGGGRFFNELRCRSNAGRPWYLKAHLLGLRHLDTNRPLKADSLTWRVVDFTGAAEPAGGRQDAKPFDDDPVLVYASQGADEKGREVILRFQYTLTTPEDAPAGTYVGEVIFTMAETP
ncbi:MAG: hypothetical protein COV75_04365 [Candidatus Omnitrophica bacterium CG11_big_fil_rev_8_21_14_0_20_63_9]|nr:MAG: hypothetical protein COV75_04365 [Candidatus Omnitrophica bacterium CG11_big_fil_rev_8_21_14_0_20_63_9]